MEMRQPQNPVFFSKPPFKITPQMYPQQEASIPNPVIMTAEAEQTLEDSFSRLGLSDRHHTNYWISDPYVTNPASGTNGFFGDSITDYGFIPEPPNRVFGELSNRGFSGIEELNFELQSRTLRDLRMGQESMTDTWGLEDLRGRILYLALDQYGCRFLQANFRHITQEEIDMVFTEIINYLNVLMPDPYGNYLFQKLVEVCSDEQRNLILLKVLNLGYDLFAICLNTHGTRSVQKLLDHLTTKRQVTLAISVLSRGAVPLTMDPNGHHVIKYCLNSFTYEDNKSLLYEVANNCVSIAMDKSGCCVLQLCIENAEGECRDVMLESIIINVLTLSEDCYGNYVVQFVLSMKIPSVVGNILRRLRGRYVAMSFNKFASNVVEKCLQETKKPQSEQIVMEILKDPRCPSLLVDPYGNYVMQTALSVSEGHVLRALGELIQKRSSSLRNNQYGKKVIDRYEKKGHHHHHSRFF